MSAFDVSLNVLGTSLAVPDEEALKQGAEPNIEVSLAVALQLPFGQPGGAPMMAHLGNVKYILSRDTAVEFFEKGLEAAQGLPAPSKLTVAQESDMEGIAKAVEGIEGLKK